ncbi:MAG: pentapeptide repeat-containing protein [Algicola sp.]|nr:pentapeptide repeat-containing protein [Algicola sp.]
MRHKVYILLAAFVGIILGATFANITLDFFSKNINLLLIVVGVIICLVGVFFIAVFYLRKNINREFFGVENEELTGLNNSLGLLVDGILTKNNDIVKRESNHISRKLAAWYSWLKVRQWTVIIFQALFVSFGGLLGTLLLYNQNEIMTQQNERIDNQNELINAQNNRLDQQTYLQEADRRAALIFELTSILDEVDEEMDGAKYQLEASRTRYITQQGESIQSIGRRERRRNRDTLEVYTLSDRLAGRIVSLTRSLRPYRYLNNDGILIRTPLSPEKGQLLTSLLDSGIDMEDLNHNNGLDFSYSDLSKVQLENVNLIHSELKYSSFVEASIFGNFYYSKFDFSNFTKANLRGSIFGCSFVNSIMTEADLSNCDFIDSYFENTDLRYANLSNIKNWYNVPMTCVNIFGIKNAPSEFIEHALENGAVQIEKDEDWQQYVKQNCL